MECDTSFWRVGRAVLVIGVVRFGSPVTALWILLLGTRGCDRFGLLSMMRSQSHGLPWKSRECVFFTAFLVVLAVRPFFLFFLVIAVNQRLQTLGLVGSLTASRLHEETGQVSAQLGVEAGR